MTILNKGLLINPERLCPETLAWIGHIPFAGWIMEEHKPTVMVELGTHTGVSYSAFCQAVIENNLPTKCYAVDTWQGEEHAGNYDNSVYDEYSLYHQQRFASFSQLLRMTFDDALSYFTDGSVDLLHIDGLHTYEACKHDFDTWLPKMSELGIILFHDTKVREREFGVWKLWEEVSKQYPAFEFHHSHGLGVLLVGKDIPEPVRMLQRDSAWAVNHLFPRMAESLYLRNDLNVRDTQITNLKQTIKNQDEHLAQTITEFTCSTSWRLTKPLRIIVQRAQKARIFLQGFKQQND